jgi:hypothetical protein
LHESAHHPCDAEAADAAAADEVAYGASVLANMTPMAPCTTAIAMTATATNSQKCRSDQFPNMAFALYYGVDARGCGLF